MPKSTRRKRSGRAFWQRMIRQWRAEGAGAVRAFCRRHGVTESTFYLWRRKLAEESSASAGASGRADSPFVPVRLTGPLPPAANAAIEILLPCGTLVRVPAHADGTTLRDVLGALGEVPCDHGREEGGC